VKRPSAEQLEIARRLLAHEAHGEQGVEEIAEAAGRVHQKLFARLASLLGVGGARALLARSVKSTAVDFPTLHGLNLDKLGEGPAELLAAFLRAESPATATAIAVMLCARLLALLATLIGERLTLQLLQSAWPTFDLNAPSNKPSNKET
jgi:hypothetical protein